MPTGTTQADYQAWTRANRFPTSYGPGNLPADADGDDGSGSTREDLLILSAILRGVDIMEIYSPPSVTEVCRKYWLGPGESLYLKTGWDRSDRNEQRRARDLVRARAPYLIICSPRVQSSATFRILIKQSMAPSGTINLKLNWSRRKNMSDSASVSCVRSSQPVDTSFSSTRLGRPVGTCRSCSLSQRHQAYYGSERINACTALSPRKTTATTRLPRSRPDFSVPRGASLMNFHCAVTRRMFINT